MGNGNSLMRVDKKVFLSFYMFLVFLFFTLDLRNAYVFYGNLVLFIPVLVLIRFFYYPKISIKKLIGILILVILWETIVYIQSMNSLYDSLIINSQRSIFLFVSMLLIADMVKEIDRSVILKSLNVYIVFLSLIIIFQFLGFYVLGMSPTSIDVSVLLGGEISRSEYMDGMYRPTGLMSEPAAFVGAQIGLLCLQYLISKENSLARILGVCSVLLSFSFAGFILIALYCLVVYSKGIKNLFLLIFMVILGFIGLEQVIKDRLEILGSSDDTSNNVKFEAFQYFISDPMNIMFGYGNIVRTEKTPIFFEGTTDITFFLAIVAIFGVIIGGIILILFFIWLFKSNYNYKEKIIILLPLIKLSNPALIFFSCFILLVLQFNRRERG